MNARELLKDRLDFEFTQEDTKFRSSESTAYAYLPLLLMKINANAEMSEEQANCVIMTILERVMWQIQGRQQPFSVIDMYSLATYVNSCRV